MLTLYFKPNDPFSNQVLAVIDQLELEAELKDVTADPEAAAAVATAGDDKQAPYLVDAKLDAKLFDSETIVKHLREHYGPQSSVAGPRVHRSDSVCIACEG